MLHHLHQGFFKFLEHWPIECKILMVKGKKTANIDIISAVKWGFSVG